MKTLAFIKTLHTSNRELFFGGVASIVLAAIIFTLFIFDDRELGGINVWIKPLKFALSFFVFLWTFAWILGRLPYKKNITYVSYGLLVCAIMEAIPITLQAARGVTSHYNVSTAFDGISFLIMGIFIALNTLIVIYIAWLFFQASPTQPFIYAIRGGLVIFILGAISGRFMVAHAAPTVGAADGGRGLWFLNWSTDAGDLRVAHFFTLHALQAVPLLTLLLPLHQRQRKIPVILIAGSYAIFCIFLHVQALSENPFISTN